MAAVTFSKRGSMLVIALHSDSLGLSAFVTLNENPNYETKSSYSFTVTATDAGGNFDAKAVTLDINNVDEVAPSITSLATPTVKALTPT